MTPEEIDIAFSKESTAQWYADWNSPVMLEQAENYKQSCLKNTEFYNNKNSKGYCKKVHDEGIELTDWFLKRRLTFMGHPRRLINQNLINVFRSYLQLKRALNESQKSAQRPFRHTGKDQTEH